MAAHQQMPMDYGRDQRVSEAQRRLLRVLNDAVDSMGLMVAAGACGCRTSDLSDALSGRANRYMRSEWLLALLDAARPEIKADIARALVEWTGAVAITTPKPRTAEERLAAMEMRIAARFGQAGLELVEEERRG